MSPLEKFISGLMANMFAFGLEYAMCLLMAWIGKQLVPMQIPSPQLAGLLFFGGLHLRYFTGKRQNTVRIAKHPLSTDGTNGHTGQYL